MSLAERRRCVTYLRIAYATSERRACQALQLSRSSYRHISEKPAVDDGYLRVVSLSRYYASWRYRKIYVLIKGEGCRISRERVRLIRCREGMPVVRKRWKHKMLGMTTQWVHRARYPNRLGLRLCV